MIAHRDRVRPSGIIAVRAYVYQRVLGFSQNAMPAQCRYDAVRVFDADSVPEIEIVAHLDDVLTSPFPPS